MSTSTKEIKKAVKDFLNGEKYVYATPDTKNHSANFYGDTKICCLCQRDVVSCIETMETMIDSNYSAIDTVLNDLQFERPE